MPLAAVLAIGFLLVAAATYQVSVVPAETAASEYEHSVDVRESFVEAADAVDRSATDGTVAPTSVPIGPRYPFRAYFVGPAPADGRLETVGPGTIEIQNASYRWSENPDFDGPVGLEREYETAGLRYEPDYAEYAIGAETRLEHGVPMRRSPSGSGIALADQSLIDGSSISLIALDGSISRSGGGSAGSTTLSNRPVSVDKGTSVTVESDGSDPLTLVLPTRLDESAWNRSFRGELTENGGNVANVAVVSGGAGGADRLRVELAPGTYDLSLARVAVGDGAAEPEPEYLYPVTQNQSVRAGSTVPVSVEVRDGYDNRVTGVDVTFSVEGENRTVTTDESGAATYEYTPSDSGSETRLLTARAPTAAGVEAPVEITFTVVS
ncbi:hypothetical protein JCM31271_04360 [Halorubrum trueperi]